MCLNFSGIVRIVWMGHVRDWLEFSLLVEFIILRMVSDRIFCACCSCLGNQLKFSVPVSVFFPLVWIPCLFPFFKAWILCPLFSCFIWVNPIHRHLTLVARELASEVFFFGFK